MRVLTTATVIGAAAVLTFGLAGCRKKQDTYPPAQGYAAQQPGYGYGQPGYGTQPGAQPGYGTQPAPGTTAAPAPAPAGTTPAGQPAGGQCQELDAASAVAAQPVLTALAQNEVEPGSKPVGGLMACNFQAGQKLEKDLQMEPGKCYTIVGAGVGVQELNLQLVASTPIPNMAPVLAEDKETGAQAVIGKKPNCYKWPLPMAAPIKLVITAAAGSGIAGAQVYAK